MCIAPVMQILLFVAETLLRRSAVLDLVLAELVVSLDENVQNSLQSFKRTEKQRLWRAKPGIKQRKSALISL